MGLTRSPGGEDSGDREDSTDPAEAPGRLSRKPIYDGRIVHLSLDSVRFPDGSTGEVELVTHPGASAVLPLLDSPDEPDPRIVLIHQYRYAAGGLLYEVPAGIPEGEESWGACAIRELAEETGFEADELRYLTRIFTTPGFTDEEIHLFAASGLRPSKAAHDQDEFIEVVTLRLSEALEAIRTGEIVDAKSICTVLFASTFLGPAWKEDRTTPPR